MGRRREGGGGRARNRAPQPRVCSWRNSSIPAYLIRNTGEVATVAIMSMAAMAMLMVVAVAATLDGPVVMVAIVTVMVA